MDLSSSFLTLLYTMSNLLKVLIPPWNSVHQGSLKLLFFDSTLGKYDFYFIHFLAVIKGSKVSGVLLYLSPVTFLLTLLMSSEIVTLYKRLLFSGSVMSDSLRPRGLQHARLPSHSITTSWSLLNLMSVESVIPSNHLILCCPLLFLPSIFPSISVFSNESALRIR